MKNRTFQPIVVLVMLVATALAGCTMPVTPAPAAPPAASSGEVVSGELIVYTSRAESLFKPVLEAFSQANPDIKVTVLTGSNGELAAKLLEERANP